MAVPTGTTDNSATVSHGPTSTGSSGNVTSGTASEAMIKAAEAASSAEETTGSQAATGDTLKPGETGTPPAQAGATKPVATAGQPPATGTQDGPVPLERHKAAVENAFDRGVSRVATVLGLDPQTFGTTGIKALQVAVNLARELQTDSMDFLRRLASDHKMRLVQMDGRPTEADLADEAMPEADFQTPNGQGVYSGKSVMRAMEIQAAKLRREFQAELNPLKQGAQTRQTAEEEAAAHAEMVQRKDLALAEARKLPHFTENEDAIAEVLKTMDPQLKRSVGAIAAMHLAYGQVMRDRVLPSIKTKTEEEIRTANRKKAGAGGVHPTDSSTGVPASVKPGDVEGLAAWMRNHESSASA